LDSKLEDIFFQIWTELPAI